MTCKGVHIVAKHAIGWFGEGGDKALWRHLTEAFKIDGLKIVRRLSEGLEGIDLPRVFLEPPINESLIDHEFIDLKDFEHPDECVYLFGNASSNNLVHVRPQDTIVTIRTPDPDTTAVFGVCIAAIVLYDREMKKNASV